MAKDDKKGVSLPFLLSFFIPQENLKSQNVISSWGGDRFMPYVFTEQGFAMLSSVLKSLMHSRALYINQIDSAFDNAVHFDFPAVRFQEGLVFLFGPFVREADAHEAQEFLPQVLLAAFAEKEVRGNQQAAIL